MAHLEEARRLLRTSFGLSQFRPGQEDVIAAVLEGRDCVVVMPTGGGKSLCYQLPALLLPGRTLVISPLIALMKDQAEALQRRGIPATFINSSLSFDEQRHRLQEFLRGETKILFIAPERFRSASFLESLRRQEISLVAVDEAHCISHWGHDFRPEYLNLGSAIEALGRPQVIALTATATPMVRLDIIEHLKLRHPAVFVSGFDRENLRLQVIPTRGSERKLDLIAHRIGSSEDAGIIYAATRRAVSEIAERLRARALPVVAYHAGLSAAEREEAQDLFMTGRARAIVATNAFGMGIDKPDIRFVIHYHIPGAVEDYYQEVGRAGRDGHLSDGILLFQPSDIKIQEFFIAGNNPPPELIRRLYGHLLTFSDSRITIRSDELQSVLNGQSLWAVMKALTVLERAGHLQVLHQPEGASDCYHIALVDRVPVDAVRIDPVELARRAAFDLWKLRAMVDYADTDECLRKFILRYFGDQKPLDRCGMCSRCICWEHRSGRWRAARRPGSRISPSALDPLIWTSAPSGETLRQVLAEESERLRRLRQIERDATRSLQAPAPAGRDLIHLGAAQSVLQCVAAFNNRFGKTTIAALLVGSRRRVIRQNGMERSPFHGQLSHLRQAEVVRLLDGLIRQGYLSIRHVGSYPVLELTAQGWNALKKAQAGKLQ
ncbi:MAG TPA: ATP-dependent DNA helicase RecQ [Blastocatellia bacterium]|nr:ATP-dependent DNA helicase RecQ [Blastocatellia bacterium]